MYIMATDVKPHDIAIADSDIEKLNLKLAGSRLPTEGSEGWDRGTPIKEVRRIFKYWHDTFNWSSFVERLNQLPNYEATILLEGFEPFTLHFVHERSPLDDASPLLFVHVCTLLFFFFFFFFFSYSNVCSQEGWLTRVCRA
jgi:hypothetical protein